MTYAAEVWYNTLMKAWKITAPRTVEQISSPSEPVGPGQVKVKIGYCLVSRPDIMTYKAETAAELPVVPGGSCCGMVVETGEGVGDLERGDRVFIHPQKYCGVCAACKAGHYSSCENVGYYGITCDGFMRDFAVVQSIDCTKLPERIQGRDAVFLDYIAIAVQTISALDIRKGEHIVIAGASTLGIILGQVALYYQTVPILVDTNPEYLDKASQLGIYYTINAAECNARNKIFHITGGKMAECAAHIASGLVPILVDTNPEYLDKASQLGIYYTINAAECNARNKIFHITGGKMAECAAHIASGEIPVSDSISFAGRGGRLAIVGRYGCRHELDCSLRPVIENGITVIGVSSGAKNTQVAVNMLANKAVSVAPLVTGEAGFDDIPRIFEENADVNNHLKTVIKMD